MRRQFEMNYEYLIRSIMIKSKQKADMKLASYGLNSQQGHMISYIAEHEEKGLIQKDLEKYFHRRGASITSMLQGLERKGYIARRISATDERQKNLYVLPPGKELIAAFNQLFEETEASITASLTPEEATEFYRLLMKVNQSIT